MDAADELRRLRARAYGPHADIASDPAALARLEELERLARISVPVSAATAVAEPREAPVPATAADPADESPASEPAAPGTDEPTDADAPAPPVREWRRWSRRRRAVVAAVALVAVVVVAVGVTSFVTRRSGYVAPVAAVLDPAVSQDVPPLFGMTSDESVLFAEFAGLTPIVSQIAWNSDDPHECLVVVAAEALADASRDSFPGVIYSACGAGPFPAVVTFSVSSQSPAELRERYPLGSSLQFILEDGAVVVLAAVAEPSSEETSRG